MRHYPDSPVELQGPVQRQPISQERAADNTRRAYVKWREAQQAAKKRRDNFATIVLFLAAAALLLFFVL